MTGSFILEVVKISTYSEGSAFDLMVEYSRFLVESLTFELNPSIFSQASSSPSS